ncbi:hypothetical protein [Kitasatospora sp. HPMI-4]|uniref:hypothetical protein n=1 Tax=Kitasatospora sp. HPMI-4 TaxID=3448443 RepID=UPI003F1BD68F
MRNKRIIAALAGVALTGAIATTVQANAATVPVPQTAAAHASQADQAQSLQQIHELGLLGDLTSRVDDVAQTVKTNPQPDKADFQAQVDAARDAVATLQAETDKVATRQGAAPRSLTSDLAKLNTDLAKLLADVLAGNAAAIPGDLAAIAADLVAILNDILGVLDAPAAAQAAAGH